MTLQKLLGAARRAVEDYRMIEDGDRIAVGVSGGKDSLALAAALAAYRRFSPEKYELCAIHVDLEAPGGDPEGLPAVADYIQSLGIPFTVVKSGIYEILFEQRKESNPCSLCSKLRRGMLNSKALELGCNKLALGHHADDAIETFLLSLFYEGRLSTFSPLSVMTRTNVTLIRPLIYAEERDINGFSKTLPVLRNPCPADKHTRREYMKGLIRAVQKDIPFAKERLISAVTHPERNNLWPERQAPPRNGNKTQ